MFLSVLTNSKQLDSSISQALCRRDNIILRFPICDEDSNLGYANTRARLWLETVLQDIGQGEAWRESGAAMVGEPEGW